MAASPSLRRSFALLLSCAVLCAHWFVRDEQVNQSKAFLLSTSSKHVVGHTAHRTNAAEQAAVQLDTLTAYAWRSNLTTEPSHGESVNPADWLYTLEGGLSFGASHNASSSVFDIDQVHRHGWPHVGAWIFCLDSHQRLLLSKRGPTMVTCPNSWSLIGEHAKVGEEAHPHKIALRGLQEEVGDFVQPGIIQQHANLNSNNNAIYYFRNYGPHLANRIDRQFTYFYWVQLNVTGEAVLELAQQRKRNEEVTQMQWVTVRELESWLETKPQDFCHDTIHSFFRIGLLLLQQRHDEQREG